VPLDPQQLPDGPQALRKMIVDLSAQLDRQAAEKLKIERMVRELLDAKRLQSSERLSPEQLGAVRGHVAGAPIGIRQRRYQR
jgi:hypothetical protein